MNSNELSQCERFKAVRIALNKKQGDFAKTLAISQGHASDIENGRKCVSDRLVEILSLKYNINEKWLRDGEGTMFEELDRDEEIAAWSSKITRSDYDKQFVPEFVHMLSKLDESDWETLEKIVKMLAKKKD